MQPLAPTRMPSQRHTPTSVLTALFAATALLAACATPPPEPTPAPAPAPVVAPAPAPEPPPPPPPPPPAAPQRSAGAEALREGLAAYQARDWRRTESRLADALRAGLNAEEQLDAHKTLAFTFCVTQRAAQCEQSFTRAFAVDPKFDLTRAERGHPLWGPVFTKVQRAQATRR